MNNDLDWRTDDAIMKHTTCRCSPNLNGSSSGVTHFIPNRDMGDRKPSDKEMRQAYDDVYFLHRDDPYQTDLLKVEILAWQKERRHAWDMYAAAGDFSGWTTETIATSADLLLAERDKRFPRPE